LFKGETPTSQISELVGVGAIQEFSYEGTALIVDGTDFRRRGLRGKKRGTSVATIKSSLKLLVVSGSATYGRAGDTLCALPQPVSKSDRRLC
jgi:hypothetical protein